MTDSFIDLVVIEDYIGVAGFACRKPKDSRFALYKNLRYCQKVKRW
jgi:hypothetical protein